MLQPGSFIKSTALLKGDYFEESIIILTEVNDKGVTGFVVNRKFPRSFNELQEFRHSPGFPLYEGGPVDQEHLFVLHRRPGLIPGSEPVDGIFYRGGDFKETVKLINNRTLTEKDIFLFVGYCGWDRGGLEAEMDEGSWEVINYKL